MEGQIKRGSKAGDFIYNLCLQDDINIVLEIGTWKGDGSTSCVMDAFLLKEQDCKLYSLESNAEMFFISLNGWEKRLEAVPSFLKDRLEILYGRIIDIEDIPSIDELRKHELYKEEWEKWYNDDMYYFLKNENIFKFLPYNFDLVILDGGEFSTEAEFEKLKDRFKYIFLDDTKTLKCKNIREKLLLNKKYKVLIDEQNLRNGFSCFKLK